MKGTEMIAVQNQQVQTLVQAHNALIRQHDAIGVRSGWQSSRIYRDCLMSIIDAIGAEIDRLIS